MGYFTVLIVMALRVPENRSEDMAVSLDWVGAILATFSLGAIVYGLIESNSLGLGNPLVLVSEASGIIALIAFIMVELRSAAPMMPLKLFLVRTFSGTNLLTLFLYAGLSGAIYFLPFNLIQVQGYTPTEAGAAFIPFTLLLFTLSRWSGGLVTRYGAKLPLVIGPLVTCVGFILFSLPDVGGSYWTTFFPAILTLGVGMAFTIAPLTTAVLGAVDDRYAGTASGINNAVSRIAGLLAIAVLNIFVLVAFNWSLNGQLDALHVSPTVSSLLDDQRAKLAGAVVPAAIHGGLHTALQHAIAESFVSGFRLAMLIRAGLAFISAVCALLLVEGKK